MCTFYPPFLDGKWRCSREVCASLVAFAHKLRDRLHRFDVTRRYALYIELKDAEAEDNIDLEPGTTADLDKDGHIIAVEILRASQRLGPGSLEEFSFIRAHTEQAAATAL